MMLKRGNNPQRCDGRCIPHIVHHTSHTAHHTSHITHHTSHITHHTSHITHHTSHIITHRTPHITHHISHITHHTSHITHHTSHITQDQVHLISTCQLVMNANDYCVSTQLVKANGKQKDDVTILHVVCMKGFKWTDSEDNKPPTCCCYVNQNGKDVCCGIMFALQQQGDRFICFIPTRLLRSTFLQVHFLEHVNNVQKGAACTALACRPRSCKEQCNHSMFTKLPDLVSTV